MNQSPDSSKPPVALIADQHELQRDYVAVPSDTEHLNDTKKFMDVTHATHGKLTSVIDTIRGPEDREFAKAPWNKINRIALLEASTAPESIQQSYDLYAALEKIGNDAPVIRLRIQRLLGYMNNYDPYINMRGVLGRKEALLERYAEGANSSREQRFAVIAAQAMDILTLQCEQEFRTKNDNKKDLEDKNEEKADKKEKDEKEKSRTEKGYEKAHEIAKRFLSVTGAEKNFSEMGFSLGDTFEDYRCPEGHVENARTQGISGQPLEIAFITVHQVFETYFEEALAILRKISETDIDQVSEADLDDVTLLLSTSNQYFEVLTDLLSRPKFLAMRESFGIASGAQSQQYHLMESYIGFQGDEQSKEMRYKGIQHLLGSRNVDAIKQEIPAEKSLKVRLGGEKRLYSALRRLNLALLEFKAIHGDAMLFYLDPGMAGSGGTEITKFFAKGMGAVFPVFTEEELLELEDAKKKAEYNPEKNDPKMKDSKKYLDRFRSVLAFIKKAQPEPAKT